jgi:hypothetical protein
MVMAATAHLSTESVSALVPEWTALHEASGTGLPFTAPEFVVTWLRHFADAANTPVVYEVREGDRLVGVAPFYRHRMWGGLSRLQPVGTGQEWIGPFEVPGLLAAPGRGREVARSVVTEMCREPVDWDWANVSLGDAAPWFEPEWLPAPELTPMVKHLTAAVVLDLQRPAVDEILVGRRNVKESIRLRCRRLGRAAGGRARRGAAGLRPARPAARVPVPGPDPSRGARQRLRQPGGAGLRDRRGHPAGRPGQGQRLRAGRRR